MSQKKLMGNKFKSKYELIHFKDNLYLVFDTTRPTNFLKSNREYCDLDTNGHQWAKDSKFFGNSCVKTRKICLEYIQRKDKDKIERCLLLQGAKFNKKQLYLYIDKDEDDLGIIS